MPLMMRLRMGKFCGAGEVPTGNSVISAPPSYNLFGEPRIFFGIHDVDSGAEDGDRLSLGRHRAAMRRSIDTARQTADNHQAASGEVGGEALGHAAAVGRGMTRSDHRNAGLRQHFDASLDEQDYRWIVNLLQPRRIFGIAEANNSRARLGRLHAFLLRQFERLARGDRLRGNGAHPHGFEFGQAGLEYALGSATVLDQFLDARRAQSLRESQREPVDALLRSGVEGGNGIGHILIAGKSCELRAWSEARV
jgi:hypothetical protein